MVYPDVRGMAGSAKSVTKIPKLLFLVTEDWYFCSHRLPIACAARDAGFEVVVATRVRDHGAPIRSAGLKLIPLRLRRGNHNLLGEIGGLAQLIEIYREERPDIVHHVAMKPILYGSLASRLTGVPAVVNAFAGMGYLFISSGWKARALKAAVMPAFRKLLRHPNGRVIIQNPDDIRMLTSSDIISERSVSFIRGSGVDTEAFSPSQEPAGAPRVVLPARILRDKGVREFVDAARILKKENVRCGFVLAGRTDPDNPSSISEEEIRAWQEEGVVTWLGHREDMPQVYSGSHIVCLPSYREGLPKALLEAAASGRPIVATDVPGCREIVRDGENGYLVPERDSKKLASALRRLIESPSLRLDMGMRGREIALAEFSIERVAKDTLRVYDELLLAMPDFIRMPPSAA